MKIILFYIIVLLISTSCGEKADKPSYLWEEDKFVDVMTKFQMAEAILRLGYNRTSDGIYDADSVYASALKEAGVSQAIFDSNYNYYLNHPKDFERIYKKVIVRLNESSARLVNEKNIENNKVDKKDSIKTIVPFDKK